MSAPAADPCNDDQPRRKRFSAFVQDTTSSVPWTKLSAKTFSKRGNREGEAATEDTEAVRIEQHVPEDTGVGNIKQNTPKGTLFERMKKSAPADARLNIPTTAPGLFLQLPLSWTTKASLVLSHPIETRLGTCTVASAMVQTGIIWTVCCKSDWIARASTHLRSISNVPVRAIVFLGIAAFHLNPPEPKWDARQAAHQAFRGWKSFSKRSSQE